MNNGTILRGLRGAITVDRDDAELIRAGTREMLAALFERNDIDRDSVVSMIFTASPDMKAEFPAVAAREMGMSAVPLICATEIDVPGSMPLCVRVLVHCYMPVDRPPRHVYLREAVRLRADLAGEANVQ